MLERTKTLRRLTLGEIKDCNSSNDVTGPASMNERFCSFRPMIAMKGLMDIEWSRFDEASAVFLKHDAWTNSTKTSSTCATQTITSQLSSDRIKVLWMIMF